MAWGVLVGHEPMPVGRWIGFALIWVALGRADRRIAAEGSPNDPMSREVSIPIASWIVITVTSSTDYGPT